MKHSNTRLHVKYSLCLLPSYIFAWYIWDFGKLWALNNDIIQFEYSWTAKHWFGLVVLQSLPLFHMKNSTGCDEGLKVVMSRKCKKRWKLVAVTSSYCSFCLTNSVKSKNFTFTNIWNNWWWSKKPPTLKILFCPASRLPVKHFYNK